MPVLSAAARERNARRSALIDLRITAENVKYASLGGDQETAFEQSFASLAYTYIKDKAPRLLDYLVGFQLVDRNEDSTKAVGVFGFKVGKEWLYAPVFFLNGDLKGHELLYLKSQDMFVPMDEPWVTYVTGRKQSVLGRGVPRNPREIFARSPDLTGITRPPLSMKFSAAHHYPNVAVAGWLSPSEGFSNVYGALTVGDLWDSMQASLSKHASLSSEKLLQDVISHSLETAKLAVDACDQYAWIGDGLARLHGDDFLADALNKVRQAVKSGSLDDAMGKTVFDYHFKGKGRRRANRKKKSILPGSQEKTSAGPAVEIRLRDEQLTTENGPSLESLSEEESSQLARSGYLVKDERSGDEVSVAYNTQQRMELTNPHESGVYEILQKPATFVRALVIVNPQTSHGHENFATVVRLDGGKDWVNAHPTTLFAKPREQSREEFAEWYDGLSDASLEVGGTYVLVNCNGNGTVPFVVNEKLGDKRYKIGQKSYADKHRPGYLPAVADSDGYAITDWSSGPSLLYLDEREGTGFRSANNILQAPTDCKAIRIDQSAADASGDDVPSPFEDDAKSENADKAFEPGTIEDIQTEILAKTAALKVVDDGFEVSINNGPRQTKIAAVVELVRDHGLRVADAETILKAAATSDGISSHGSRFRILYGPNYPREKQAYSLAGGPMAPAIPEQSLAYAGMFGQVPTGYPEEHALPVDELSSQLTDQDIYNPDAEFLPDPQTMQTAQTAAQSGQREVFDTTIITGLLKSVRQDSQIARFLPDLLKALDRLGRLLFLFYWHQNEFADRYGKQDLPEMEDSLRNSFESLGELVLFIKSKDVEPISAAREISVEDSDG